MSEMYVCVCLCACLCVCACARVINGHVCAYSRILLFYLMPTTVIYLDSSLDNNTQYSINVYDDFVVWIDVTSYEDQGYVTNVVRIM